MPKNDMVFTLTYLFQLGVAPPCLDAADTNDDGAINIADAIGLLKGIKSVFDPKGLLNPGKIWESS